jgi:hypothetical protein
MRPANSIMRTTLPSRMTNNSPEQTKESTVCVRVLVVLCVLRHI